MFDIGTIEDKITADYYGFDFENEIQKYINPKDFSNVDLLIMKELHSNINCGRIKVVMDALNWTWGMSNKPPQIKEIQYTALETITKLFISVKQRLKYYPNFFNDAENIPYSISTAGFSVSCYDINVYKIDFTVTNWETFSYYENRENDEYYKKYCPEYYEARKIDQRKGKIKNIVS